MDIDRFFFDLVSGDLGKKNADLFISEAMSSMVGSNSLLNAAHELLVTFETVNEAYGARSKAVPFVLLHYHYLASKVSDEEWEELDMERMLSADAPLIFDFTLGSVTPGVVFGRLHAQLVRRFTTKNEALSFVSSLIEPEPEVIDA